MPHQQPSSFCRQVWKVNWEAKTFTKNSRWSKILFSGEKESSYYKQEEQWPKELEDTGNFSSPQASQHVLLLWWWQSPFLLYLFLFCSLFLFCRDFWYFAPLCMKIYFTKMDKAPKMLREFTRTQLVQIVLAELPQSKQIRDKKAKTGKSLFLANSFGAFGELWRVYSPGLFNQFSSDLACGFKHHTKVSQNFPFRFWDMIPFVQLVRQNSHVKL